MPQQPLTEATFKNSTVTWSLLLALLVVCIGVGMYFTDYIKDVRDDYRQRITTMQTEHAKEVDELSAKWQSDMDRALQNQKQRMEWEKELALLIQQADNDRARNDRRITRGEDDIQVLYNLVDQLTKKTLGEQ